MPSPSFVSYAEASSRFENTEIGYTFRSMDKVWEVFGFEDSPGVPVGYQGARVFPTGVFHNGARVWSYDLRDEVLVCHHRWEAERLKGLLEEEFDGELYVVNHGDYARWEDRVFFNRVSRLQTKYAGSRAAIAELSRRRIR